MLTEVKCVGNSKSRRRVPSPRSSGSSATTFGFVGFYLAAGLPPLYAGALLFLTPMSFLISTANNSRMMLDKLALVLGLVLGTVLTYWHFNLDLMWTGLVGGTLAYLAHRFREAMQ
jgi:hypothetical protein